MTEAPASPVGRTQRFNDAVHWYVGTQKLKTELILTNLVSHITVHWLAAKAQRVICDVEIGSVVPKCDGKGAAVPLVRQQGHGKSTSTVTRMDRWMGERVLGPLGTCLPPMQKRPCRARSCHEPP